MSTKTRPWKTSIFQGAAVLGGVLLALGADATWDYQTDRMDEREYLHAFRVDFEANRARLHQLMSDHDVFDRDLKRLITVIDSAGRSQITADSIQVLLRPMYVAYAFDPILATLDDLTQSGSLNLIRDDSLRLGLAEFQRDLEAIALGEQYVEQYWSTEMVALFRDDLVLRDLPGFLAELEKSTFTADFTALLQTRRFENQVVQRWALNSDLQRAALPLATTVDQILERQDLLLAS